MKPLCLLFAETGLQYTYHLKIVQALCENNSAFKTHTLLHTGQFKMSLSLLKHHAMKTDCGMQIQLHVFLTLAINGDEWSASTPGK
jgi:hypothetical protein